jgi:hypothetical protein
MESVARAAECAVRRRSQRAARAVTGSQQLREAHLRLLAAHEPHLARRRTVAQQMERLRVDQRVVAVLVQQLEADVLAVILEERTAAR